MCLFQLLPVQMNRKSLRGKPAIINQSAHRLGILIIHNTALNIEYSAMVAVLILKAVCGQMLDGSSLFDLVLNWYQFSIPIPRSDSVCINVEYFKFNKQLITGFFYNPSFMTPSSLSDLQKCDGASVSHTALLTFEV